MVGTNSSSHERLDVEATLTEVKRLQIDRAYRDASGLFYVEGVRNFVKVVDNSFDISAIVFSEKLLTAPLSRKLVRVNRRNGVLSISVTPEQFRRISHTERASGVGAIVRQRWSKLHEVSPQAGLCWAAMP